MHTRHSTGTDVTDTDPPFYFPRMDAHPYQQQQQQQQQQNGAGPSISSQNLIRHRNNPSSYSLSSHISLPTRVSTLEAYELIYGGGPIAPGAAPAETVERLYEAHAVYVAFLLVIASLRLADRGKNRYENPLITASSRQIIGDINALSRQLRELDVPRPLAMFKTLFRPSHLQGEPSESWFQALRVWSEIDEVYDSESFDGHRLSIIEHTLNVLILPGLHSDERGGGGAEHVVPDVDSASVVSLPIIGGPAPRPALAIPGLGHFPLPSPLHLKLHVISRLSFNEQGRITRHRDFCDVRDVFALVPGVRAAQWIGTRAAAHGLAWATHLAGWALGVGVGVGVGRSAAASNNDVERGVTPTASPISAHSLNALGLHLNESGTNSSASKATFLFAPRARRTSGRARQAPDVDRDAD